MQLHRKYAYGTDFLTDAEFHVNVDKKIGKLVMYLTRSKIKYLY